MSKQKIKDKIVKKEPINEDKPDTRKKRKRKNKLTKETAHTIETSRYPVLKRKRRYRDYNKRTENILDPYTFMADQRVSVIGHGVGPTLRRARYMLLKYLRNKDYKTSLSVLATLINTNRYSASVYWRVGEEIIQRLQPESLITYLESVVVGVGGNQQMEALTECLLQILKVEGYESFRDRINNLPDTDDTLEPLIAKLVALVTYEEWRNEKDVEKKASLGSQTYDLMKLVYTHNVTDRYIVKAYLEILSQQNPRPEHVIKEVVQRTLRDTTDDPEFLSILLHYGSAEIPDLILARSNFCDLDPVADVRISFLPLMSAMKSIPCTDPYYTMISLARAKVITVRLDYGCTSSCTLEELDALLNDLSSMSNELRAHVIDFLVTAGIAATLNRLQLDTDNVTTMDVLEYLKYKILRVFRIHKPTSANEYLSRPWLRST